MECDTAIADTRIAFSQKINRNRERSNSRDYVNQVLAMDVVQSIHRRTDGVAMQQ